MRIGFFFIKTNLNTQLSCLSNALRIFEIYLIHAMHDDDYMMKMMMMTMKIYIYIYIRVINVNAVV